MKVKIFQIDFNKYSDLCFQEYEQVHKLMTDNEFINHCNLVYECERDRNYSPDTAFSEFNINHPNDYTGSSLSVGDVVVLDERAYYCDSTGWKELDL